MQPDSVYGLMSQATCQRFGTTPSRHYSNTVPEDERSVPTATNKVHYTLSRHIDTRRLHVKPDTAGCHGCTKTRKKLHTSKLETTSQETTYLVEVSSGKYPSEVRGITILMPYRDNTQHHGRKR